MKRVLIINGHPDRESFCAALAERYQQGVLSAGAPCELVHLADLDFDPILHHGYRKRPELEPDLERMQQALTDAEHLVLVYPNWWGSYPALLKGFFDRTLLPGFAFRYRKDSPLWDKLLAGRSARLLVTMDTPWWYYWLMVGRPGHNAVQKATLGFCGYAPVKISAFSPVRSSTDAVRAKWLAQVEALGAAQR
ncbi:NAD(P)H-dependent oxidoreductase [Haliangium ochraceum]|uniref:NAD(P)H dehydrogenase (Quinone) n=1 Tax=Haliangium ochraceum (strain DSM 14365 / JCM 11303 / SMP-2) TaxID=502025 RepID=D0LLZ4_HALO1|nr:NAD(P)H-dependent oxidoreductase [Haliangium ochraceum]ACY15172.1 NAD(P)H dehydrogenase (quinone) [Haliangium ochraceum DSM 14365]